MVQLQHLAHQTTCPYCNSKVIAAAVSDQHSNGHWNEKVLYDCGLDVHFTPNFMRIIEREPCRETPEGKEKSRRVPLLYALAYADYKVMSTVDLVTLVDTLRAKGAIKD